ncbi:MULTISPECIES: transposase [unclassified Pseudomonas]|uniref:transposase n=1 Tax=unclassified Pseudomonas TaxID=196821 RepID=UPI0011998643|nr:MULTISPECIES: transposase [unclassified Pseudomonas]TWC11540.1 transposase [Pseudomonas sp. SJZ074]TWC12923.1 transposase [Pseudomonas sp. SJZ075]TWC29306.1 transposase [Pseudomonas sp. SJZ078]TWC30254.1 transposase [Pseudomonas sp. SJZ085]TWC45808.1 transposase [Pseudomonas sp. SJZ080]
MRQRSSYPKLFKAQIVQECLQPGATLSGVAISHGINANVIRKWMPLFRGSAASGAAGFCSIESHAKTAG